MGILLDFSRNWCYHQHLIMADKKNTKKLTSDSLVKELDDQTVLLVRGLLKKQILPHLAVVAVGKTKDSLFIKLKKQRARNLGIILSVYELPQNATLPDIKSVIEYLNKDREIHGIIVQLPLPNKFTDSQIVSILKMITANKDVDALGKGRVILKKAKNLTKMNELALESSGYLPTTAYAMLLITKEYGINLKDGLLIVGKGRLVGNPLAEMLTALAFKFKQADEQNKNLNNAIFGAKIIMSGTNSKKPFLNDSFVQERAYVIAAGNEIDHKTLDGYAEGITPQKGGVGPLTISLLLSNTVRACIKQNS